MLFVIEVLPFEPQVAVVPEVFPTALLEAEFVGAVDHLPAAAHPAVVFGDGHHQAGVIELFGKSVRKTIHVRNGLFQHIVPTKSVHAADYRIFVPCCYSVFIFLIDSLFTFFFVLFVMHFHPNGSVIVIKGPKTVEKEIFSVSFGNENSFFIVGFPPTVGFAIHEAAFAGFYTGWVVKYFVVR